MRFFNFLCVFIIPEAVVSECLSVIGPGRENAAIKATATGRDRARDSDLHLAAGPRRVPDSGLLSASGGDATQCGDTI